MNQSKEEKLLELITKSGILGLSQKEIHESMKITPEERTELTTKLKKDGKIYFSFGDRKWKLIEYQTRYERLQQLEWKVD